MTSSTPDLTELPKLGLFAAYSRLSQEPVMKVFISWSSNRSLALAKTLNENIKGIINSVDPWLSEDSIDAGKRWNLELSEELEQSKFGIICVTPENLNSRWLHFEAGAISKAVGESYVIPVLLELKPSDLDGPLAQFQAIGTTKGDFSKLIASINRAVIQEGESGLSEGLLQKSFELWWPTLEASINQIKKLAKEVRPKRSQMRILEEILDHVRELRRESVDRKIAAFSVPPSTFETKVAGLIEQGYTVQEISDELAVSQVDIYNAIKAYRRKLLTVMNLNLNRRSAEKE